MERLVLIGVSHRRGGADALETWQTTFDPETLSGYGFAEWALLATCNRWNLVAALPPHLNVAQARDLLTPAGQTVRPYAYVGDGALEQLCRVAASLESLNPGEDQIMAQVRGAFAKAQARGTTGKLTSFAFNTALRIAKKVRRDIELAPMNTSLFSLARPALEKRLRPGDKVVVLGAGQMGTLAAKSLQDMAVEVTVVNRNEARARQLAKHLNANSMSLADFLDNPPETHALVCAISVRNIVDKSLLEKLPDLKQVVDLGVPRNVEPGAAKPETHVLDVNTLQEAGRERRAALTEKLAEAEQVVQGELELALNEWTERQLGPSIKKLREWYLDTIGDALPQEDAAKLAHKFAHVPIKGLRAVAREHGLDAAKTFLAETGLE